MDKNVIISIKGTQTYENAEPETIELVTEGRLMDCGDEGYTFSYQESELTGLEGTLTTFQVEPERITLMRMGMVNSQMVFQPGKRHFSMYDTPYGAMEVGVSAKQIHSTIGDQGGVLEIDYAIEIDHAVAGQSLFHIEVRETPKTSLLQ